MMPDFALVESGESVFEETVTNSWGISVCGLAWIRLRSKQLYANTYAEALGIVSEITGTLDKEYKEHLAILEYDDQTIKGLRMPEITYKDDN